MKYFATLILVFLSSQALAETFPSSMGELYCFKQENKYDACLDVTLERAYCMNQFSSLECRELTGATLCAKGSRTKDECKSKSFMEGFCLFQGNSMGDCRRMTAAKLICKKLGKTFEDCEGITEVETMCLSSGLTFADCKGIKAAEVLCYDYRRDLTFCKGVTLSQIPCVKKGFSRDQMAKGCE
jgi:hypothetical protein